MKDMSKYGRALGYPKTIFAIMRGQYVTGWCPDRKFAKSCAGKGERVVRFMADGR